MSKHWLDQVNYSRNKSQQFIVTYKDSSTLESLAKLGSIIYKSVVVNILFIDTEHNRETLLNVDEVMSVTSPKSGRLRNNKERC